MITLDSTTMAVGRPVMDFIDSIVALPPPLAVIAAAGIVYGLYKVSETNSWTLVFGLFPRFLRGLMLKLKVIQSLRRVVVAVGIFLGFLEVVGWLEWTLFLADLLS